MLTPCKWFWIGNQSRQTPDEKFPWGKRIILVPISPLQCLTRLVLCLEDKTFNVTQTTAFIFYQEHMHASLASTAALPTTWIRRPQGSCKVVSSTSTSTQQQPRELPCAHKARGRRSQCPKSTLDLFSRSYFWRCKGGLYKSFNCKDMAFFFAHSSVHQASSKSLLPKSLKPTGLLNQTREAVFVTRSWWGIYAVKPHFACPVYIKLHLTTPGIFTGLKSLGGCS